METPPRELRRLLQRAYEVNRCLEAELAELTEFTKLESQFMLLEEGCSKLSEERSKLAGEVESLKKSHDVFKSTLSVKFHETKNHLVDLVGQGVGADISREIALAFDDLANFLDVKGPCGDAAPSTISTSTEESLIGSKTLDMMQNELSKIKLTLKAPRRLSDSSLVVERFRKQKTAISRRNAVTQTVADEFAMPETDSPNLLDLSISALHGAGDTPEVPIPITGVRELELKLAGMREECRKLTVANNNLELAIHDKSEEIQELMDLLDETRASCTCKRIVYETEDPLNRSGVNESLRNQSSYLPTILEASFDGSDMIDSSFAPEQNSFTGPMNVFEERESPQMDSLQKCNHFLSSEINYCLSEVETKNEQITMLQSLASPAAMPAELAETCNQELKDLETLFTVTTDVFSNDDIKLDVVRRLERALSLIQKYIDSSLSSPKFDLSPELISNSSTRTESVVDESFAVLADASFPQQLCNAVFNASTNTSSLDTSTCQNPEDVKLSKIMSDVRNLRNCSFTVMSNFSRSIFEAVNKLARIECILQRLRSNSPVDGAYCLFYKSVLLKDIKRNADTFLGLDESRENYSFADLSNSADGGTPNRSHASHRRSVTRSFDDGLHFSFLTEDKLPTGDSLPSSVVMVKTADEVDSLSLQTDMFPSEKSAIHSSVIELSSKLEQLGFINPINDTLNRSTTSKPNDMKGIVLLVEELKERLDRLNPLKSSLRYDPECTQLLSMDVSSLNADSPARRILQTSQTVNHNELDEGNKENILKHTVMNYNKLILDSKSRIEEVEVAKNDAEMKLSQKLADYHLLANKLAQTSASLSEATENIITLENKAKTEALEREKLVSAVQQTSVELSQIAERNSLLESVLNVNYSEKHALENALELTSEDLQTASNRLIELEQTVNATAAEKEALNIELGRISEMLTDRNARISELEATMAADSAVKVALRMDVDTVSGEIALSRGEKQAVENKLICLSGEMSEVTERVSALGLSVSLLESEKLSIENELARAYETLSNAENKIAELERNLEACTKSPVEIDLKNELNRISEELLKATERNAELEREWMARNEEHTFVSAKLEKEVSVLQELIKKTRNEFCELIKFSSERLDILMIRNRDLQVQLCMETTKHCKSISDLQDKLAFAEAEIAELESGLCSANAQLVMKQHQIQELEAELSSDGELLKRIQDLETLSSDLSSSLELTKDNMKDLIRTSEQRINALETSCRATEVELGIALAEKQNLETKLSETFNKLQLETMDREKLASELSDSMIVLKTLQEAVQNNEEIISANNLALEQRTAENELLKSQLSDTNMNLLNVRKNFEKLILDSNGFINELQLSKRQLSVIASEESSANNKLMTELTSSEMLITQLKEFIESTDSYKPRGSLRDFCSTTPRTPRSTWSGSVLGDRSDFSCASMGVDDEHPRCEDVNFERSGFVSELPMEKTMCVDIVDSTFMSQTAVDPLSMTIMPEKLVTPRRKMLSDDESSDDSNFGTPVAGKWGNEKSPVNPVVLDKVIRLSAAKDQIETISNDIASLKLEMKTLLSHCMPSEITASLNEISCICGSLHDQLFQQKSRIAEMDDTISKLRETILAGSLEKESLRGELKKERDAVAVLKSQLGDLEMDNHVLIEERDVGQMQVTSLEKTIEEVLRLWHQDELPVSEDATQELKSLVLEVSNAKNLVSDYLNKPKNMNFFFEVKSLLSKSKSLDRTLTILKTSGLKKCKDLKDECNQIIGDTSSLRAEIQGNIQKIADAMVNIPISGPKLDDLEVLLNTHKSRIDTLEAEMSEKIALTETLQSKLQSQTDDNCYLKATNSKLLEDIQNAEVMNDDMHKKIEELQTANAGLAAEILKLQETIVSMTEQLASNEKLLLGSDELDKCLKRITDLEKLLEEKSVDNNEEKLKALEESANSLSTENAKLSEELIELKTREKDLSDQAENLMASNRSLSEKIASLLETNVELEDKLSSTEGELADSLKKNKEITSASSCAGKSSLEIVNALSSLVESTAHQPVDLTCSLDSPLDVLFHIKKVLRKTNDALNAVFSLLNTNETSGIDAIESLYLQLKDSDIRDVYMCKKRFSTEIFSLQPEMRVEDLVKLSLLELQARLVSVIMEKEQALIQNYQAEWDSKLASKQHELNQCENREKLMKEMIEELTKENEKLGKTVQELESNISTKGSSREQDIYNECSGFDSQQIQSLKDDIESLKEMNSLLELSSKEAVAQQEKLSDQLAQILSHLHILLEYDDQNRKGLTPVCQMDIKSDLRQMLSDIILKIGTMRSKATEDQLALVELDKRYKELENECKACENSVSTFQTKCAELSSEIDSKAQLISALGAEKARLESEVEELKKMLNPEGGEDAAANLATIVDLNVQLEMSAKYIEEMESRESNVEKIKRELCQKVNDLSKERDCLKEAFSKLLSDAKDDVSKAMSYVEMITRQAADLDNRQSEYSKEIEGQLDSLKNRCNDLIQEKHMLETSMIRESNEKMVLQDKVKTLEELHAKPVHRDDMCLFKAFKDHCEVVNYEKKELQELLATESDTLKRLHEKLKSLEENPTVSIHVDESCPHKKFTVENDQLRSEIQKLEITLLKLNEEKDSLLEKIGVLEGRSSKTTHDDRSCPYKEKMQEYKRDLWIIRTKAEEEKKNFDIMKKNLQEDLAFKSSTIRELEGRNEATINDFKHRLASSTVSYNQLTQKLEEANERISFLRDMNSQDKKRFEKEIEVLSKEISRLQAVSVFLQSMGVENDKILESLPVMKKKLCDYDSLETALANAEEKTAELDKECDDMCAEIKLLQSVVGEKCEENEKLKKAVEKLTKALEDLNEVMEKYKALENQLTAKIQREVHLTEELSLKESQLKDILRKLADESLAKSQLEKAYDQLESNLERCNQKINQYISQVKNYDEDIAEKAKLIHELESTLCEKINLLEELKLALEAEKSKVGAIHGQKLALEGQLTVLQKELASCKSSLGTFPEVEAKFQKLSLERDEAMRRYQEIESRMPTVQKKMQDYIQQISTLKDEQKVLLRNREDAEQNFKAQRLALVDEISKLKKDISDKNARIIEMESVMASQSDIVSYQTKISELQNEVGRLKNELAQQTSFCVRPQTTPVVVRPSPSPSQPAQRPQIGHEEYRTLEKKYAVLKRLAEMRRSKILSYQSLLAQHNIDIPRNEVST